ncbi:MAG: RNA methyltransferase [Candidatus Cloacimonetes bacterium]|nr:RNA methyltransferase [Candidatus Cloacimonadota bacterium]
MKTPERQRICKSNDKFQVIESLKQNRRKRSEHREIFIEGIESIKQALSAGARVKKVLFADYDRLSNWARETIGHTRYEELIQLENGLYSDLSDKTDPSELIITIEYEKLRLADIALSSALFILIFDRPSDNGNLGAVIRSANSFGVDAVITTGHCVDIYDPKVIRSSLGAVFHTRALHVEHFEELACWLAQAKRQYRLTIVGTDSAGDTSITDPCLKRPIALVLGNEAKGISVRFKELSDCVVNIPLQGAVNSLNVACAGSIFLWRIAGNSAER